MRTQREFMIATVKQTIQAKNILKIKDIIDIAYEYVETNLSVSAIKDYVPYAINVNIDAIRSEVLPGGSYGPSTTPSYPLWFFIPDKKEVAELIEDLYGTDDEFESETENDVTTDNTSPNTTDTSSSVSNSTSEDENTVVEISKKETAKIKIELLNGSGSDKAFTEIKKMLKDEGYDVSNKTITTTSTSKTTIINKTDVDTKFTDNIKDLLGVGNVSTSSVSSSDVDITIIIGKDYK